MKKRALCPGYCTGSFFRTLISFVFLIASFLVLPSLSFSEDIVMIESIGSSAISADNSAIARGAAIADGISRLGKYRVTGFTSNSVEAEGAV